MLAKYDESCCGALLRFCGAFVFAVWTISVAFVLLVVIDDGNVSPFVFVFLAASALPSGIVWYGIATIVGAFGQGVQDARARRAMLNASADAAAMQRRILEQHEAPPYNLYLRPFYADRRMVRNPLKSRLPFLPSFYQPRRVPWETVFMRSLRRLGRVISLGYPSSHLAADRIKVDDELWEDTFVLLAHFADRIFVWPSTTTGTLWEVEWLKSETALLSRCIFVVPHFSEIPDMPDGENWPSIRAALHEIGIQAPDEDGVLFSVRGPDIFTETLDLTGTRRLTAAIEILSSCARAPEHGPAVRWSEYEAAQSRLAAGAIPRYRRPQFAEDTELKNLTCAQCGIELPDGVLWHSCA